MVARQGVLLMEHTGVGLAARLDFLGGWTDQECWPGLSAVRSCPIDLGDGIPPVRVYRNGSVEITPPADTPGTGLGISSILHAARYINSWPYDLKSNYQGIKDKTIHKAIWYSVDKEAENGVGGGWQDAAGSLTGYGTVVRVLPRELAGIGRYPMSDVDGKLVLFDTGIRRDSREIGEIVRRKIRKRDVGLCVTLESSAQLAVDSEIPGLGITMATTWRRLCQEVPEIALPDKDMSWFLDGLGYWKLAGSGGGGFGFFVANNEEQVERICDRLDEADIWFCRPNLCPMWWYMPLGESE